MTWRLLLLSGFWLVNVYDFLAVRLELKFCTPESSPNLKSRYLYQNRWWLQLNTALLLLLLYLSKGWIYKVSNRDLKIANRSAWIQTVLFLSAPRDNCTTPTKVCSLMLESTKTCQLTSAVTPKDTVLYCKNPKNYPRVLVQGTGLQSAISLNWVCDKTSLSAALGLEKENNNDEDTSCESV